MTVLEGLRVARRGLLERNVPQVAGYYVAMVDQGQARQLEVELYGRAQFPSATFNLPAEVRRIVGAVPVVAVLFGDLVVARVQR